MATLPCGILSEGKISQKWKMCFSRNGCVPTSSVHVLVWGCICFQVWATVTFLLINWEKQNLQYQHCLLSILGAGGRGNLLVFCIPECVHACPYCVFTWLKASHHQFSTNYNSFSLPVSAKSGYLSCEEFDIYRKKEASVLFQVQTYEGHFHLIPIKPRFIFYSCNLGFSLYSL